MSIAVLLNQATSTAPQATPLPYRRLGAYRLLLASLVVWQHFSANSSPQSWADATKQFWVGSIAVLCFFVLSGFVIAEAVDRVYARRPLAYLVNRALRIVPHFVAAMLVSIVACWWFLQSGTLRIARGLDAVPALSHAFAPRDIAINLVGFLPIPVRAMVPFDFLDIAWAVRIEVAFYLVVFAVLMLARWLGRPEQANCWLAWTAVGLFMLSELGGPAKLGLAAYFAFGYAYYCDQQPRTAGSPIMLALATVAIPFSLVRHPTYDLAPGQDPSIAFSFLLLFGLLGIMMVLVAVPGRRGVRLDRWLGELTYPLYLYHVSLLVVLLSITSGYSYSTYIAGMLGSLVVAWGAARLIDPAVDRLRDHVRGRRLGV